MAPKLSVVFFIIFCAGVGISQTPVSIDRLEMCWVINGIDSSLNRYVQISSRTPATDPVLIAYTNGDGDVVNVSGGTLYYGYCSQCTRDTLPVPRIEQFGVSQPIFNPFSPNCDAAIVAFIFGVQDESQITLTLDGSPIAFTYDPVTKAIMAIADSSPGTGVHTVILTATIPTGIATKTGTFDCG